MSRLSILALLAVYSLFGVAESEQFRFKPPVNLGTPINTEWTERDPYITADGQKLFFCSDRPDTAGGLGGDMDIWMSTWNGTSWNPPVNLGPNVNGGAIEWSPSISPDGRQLYFISYARPGGYGGWDVWVTTFDSALQQWGPAENLGPVINTYKDEWCPEISWDGQSLYYTTDGYYHPQGDALFVSHWDGSAWEIPTALPDNINNTGTEERPTLTADERTMYFVRFNYYPRIYASEKDSSGAWTDPVELDTSINSPGTDPCVSPDGGKLYFSSSRSGGLGNGDIWMAKRILRGDLNIDGQLTGADVVLEINKVFLNAPYPAPEPVGDMNCDSRFTPADLAILLGVVFAGMPTDC